MLQEGHKFYLPLVKSFILPLMKLEIISKYIRYVLGNSEIFLRVGILLD